MPVCEELSVLDLLKVHVPRCLGCVQPISTTACPDPQADPALHDILTFVGALSPGKTEKKPVIPAQPNSDAVPHMFFGIALDTEVDSTLEHLACFVQSQVSPKQHRLKSKKFPLQTPTPTHMGQDHPVHPAITLHTHTPSPSTQQSSDVFISKQLSLTTSSSQQSIIPTSQQHQLKGEVSLLSPNTQQLWSHLPSQKPVCVFSPPNSRVELELHPSPSLFFKETQGEKFSADYYTNMPVSSKLPAEETVINTKVHKPEANPDPSKCLDKVDPDSTKNQEKGSGSNNRDQVNRSDLYPKKDQETNLSTSPKNHKGKDSLANNDMTNRGQKEKAGLDPGINRAKSGSGSSKVQVNAVKDLSKGQVKDGKHHEAKTGQSSSRGCEVKVSKSFSKDHIKNYSRSRKDQQSKIVSVSCKDQQDKDISRSRRGEDKAYKLPFISTDEQENRDNEDPRWKEQARLSTNQERYRLARRLWRTTCVPDPNRNLTTFGTIQLTTQHSLVSSGSRRQLRKRWHEMDEEFQPPRKRQRRFEDVDFSIKQITRSKVTVMNEYLKTLVAPTISRQAAKKLESSHKEKQYMLDLACEEIKAIQQFYNGLPDQDLTVTQEEVERGCQATEHVYQVFGDIYGYGGQEFFP